MATKKGMSILFHSSLQNELTVEHPFLIISLWKEGENSDF